VAAVAKQTTGRSAGDGEQQLAVAEDQHHAYDHMPTAKREQRIRDGKESFIPPRRQSPTKFRHQNAGGRLKVGLEIERRIFYDP
ncbi:unnamed protein product, partial [Amoebophrya sp. A25]